jgi:hypothetical protein
MGCQDDYMTFERRIIDSESKVPLYFYAEPEQAGADTWRPVFTYYIYSVDEGEFAAFFHAYVINGENEILWQGVQPITIKGGEKVWGEYVADAEFSPFMIPEITPMAYVSVSYD